MAAAGRKVAILGLGLMGGSLGLALKRAGWSVTGRDSEPDVTARALQLGAIDAAAGELGEADVVVLAVPVRAMPAVLAEVASEAPAALVTDLCSTKAAVVAWARDAGLDFVGGHPLCGRELSGIGAARADLFQGAPWALTRPDVLVEEMVVAAGGHPLVVEPAEHDALVAGGSHAAFVISAAYMLAAARSPDWPALSALTGGGFRDLTRLAAGDPAMYAGIVGTNRENIQARLVEFTAALAELSARLEDADAGEGAFAEARRARLEWEASRRE